MHPLCCCVARWLRLDAHFVVANLWVVLESWIDYFAFWGGCVEAVWGQQLFALTGSRRWCYFAPHTRNVFSTASIFSSSAFSLLSCFFFLMSLSSFLWSVVLLAHLKRELDNMGLIHFFHNWSIGLTGKSINVCLFWITQKSTLAITCKLKQWACC